MKKPIRLLLILIVPWLTVILMRKKSFKKYLPAAIFMATFTKALDIYGVNKKWWRFYKGISNFNSMNFFNLGPYLVASLWVLKMTYGKFILYLITNSTLHILYSLLGAKYMKRYKIGSLVKLTKLQFVFVNSLRALLLYGFQYISDLTSSQRNENSK